MPQLVLDLLKILFLAVLYIFVYRAVRIVYLELRPGAAGPQPAAPAPRGAARRSRKSPGRVAIVEGDSRNGRTFELEGELTIGRGDRCRIVLEDPYASQVHARLFARGDGVFVEDLGSTNGTYVNRRRLTQPVEVQRGDRVKIGRTVLELRR